MRISDDPELYDGLKKLFEDPLVQQTICAIETVRQRIYDDIVLSGETPPIQQPIPTVENLPYGAIAPMHKMGCLVAPYLAMTLVDICILNDLEGDLRFVEDAGFSAEVLQFLHEGKVLIGAEAYDYSAFLDKKSPYFLLSGAIGAIEILNDEKFKTAVVECGHMEDFQAEVAKLVKGFDALGRNLMARCDEVSFPVKLLSTFADGFGDLLVHVQDRNLLNSARTNLAEFRQKMLIPVVPLPEALQPGSYLNKMRPVWRERFKMK